LLDSHGSGDGCEICKPAVTSILASLWNEQITEPAHQTLQDTNDRFLANVQRGGLYSVVPRVPGGEITPDKLMTLGRVAKRFGLYTKITGGQRVDLFGAQVQQLPDIWEELVNAGFESGHAYGKALRTVKSCVGTTWCRYGVQDSVGFAIRLERRYRGIRSPHKMKMAVSGCIRECAEAQCKDIGLVATEHGYNLYVGGNGGARPRHAELLANRILGASATNGFEMIGGEIMECLRESCLDFLCFLRDAAYSVTNSRAISVGAEGKHRFALAEDALQVIETAPAEQLPSVEALAVSLNTTRRTLLNAFQGSLGTSPSRYMLARRLNGAQRDILCGRSPTVTDAALDYGFEHFGRFARHYRTLFGETPSATLFRAKLVHSGELS
jgi:AraC-like DNA-binding protein